VFPLSADRPEGWLAAALGIEPTFEGPKEKQAAAIGGND